MGQWVLCILLAVSSSPSQPSLNTFSCDDMPPPLRTPGKYKAKLSRTVDTHSSSEPSSQQDILYIFNKSQNTTQQEQQMSFLFGGGNPHAGTQSMNQNNNPVRECRRRLSRGIRNLQQEQKALLACEAGDTQQVRDAIQKGDPACIKACAIQLSRTKSRIRKNVSMQNRMVAMDRRFSDISSSSTMTESLKMATEAMRAVSGSNDLSSIAQIIRDFDRQNGVMDEHLSMIDEAVDTMAEEEGEDMEASKEIENVILQMGFDLDVLLPKSPAVLHAAAKSSEADKEIERRLARLKG